MKNDSHPFSNSNNLIINEKLNVGRNVYIYIYIYVYTHTHACTYVYRLAKHSEQDSSM